MPEKTTTSQWPILGVILTVLFIGWLVLGIWILARAA
jgi:hypothetical protein